MARDLASLTKILSAVPVPLMVGHAERSSDGALADMELVWANDEMNSISATGSLVGIRLSRIFPDELNHWLADLDSARLENRTYRAIRVPKEYKDPGLEIYELSGKWIGDFVVFSAIGLVEGNPQIRDSIRSAAVISKTLKMIPIAFSVRYRDGFLRFPTLQFLENMGLTLEEYRSTSLSKFVSEADRAGFTEWFSKPIAEAGSRFVYRALTVAGIERWVEVWRSGLSAEPGPTETGEIFVIRDIDVLVKLQEANKKLLQQVEQQMHLLKDALNASQDGFAIWDLVGREADGTPRFRLGFINSVGAKQTGKAPKALEGKTLQEVSGEVPGGNLMRLFATALETNQPQVQVVQVNSPEGWVGAFENRVFPINQSQILALFRDVTSERREQERLATLIEEDQLTGSLNRRAIERLLDEALTDATDGDKLVGFVFLDIDFFKRINDDFGHDVGDKVLIQFVRRAQEMIAADGYFARIAGDEFAMILPNLDSSTEVELLLERVFDGMKVPFEIDGLEISITCSAGAVAVGADMQMSEVMRLADRAMYKAKHKGRNQFVVAQ